MGLPDRYRLFFHTFEAEGRQSLQCDLDAGRGGSPSPHKPGKVVVQLVVY